MNSYKLNSEQIRELRQFLPKGSIKDIAKELNLTPQAITKCLSGNEEYYNDDIIEWALKLKEQLINRRLKISKKFREIHEKSA
jgi:hypothetical protein